MQEKRADLQRLSHIIHLPRCEWNIEVLSFDWIGDPVLIRLLLQTIFTFYFKWLILRLTYETRKIHVILIHAILGAIIIYWQDTMPWFS